MHEMQTIVTDVSGVCTSVNGTTENAGVENAARYGRGGKRRSGICGTTWQGWKMREWSGMESRYCLNNKVVSAE